jgi:hypothetical protein
MNYGKAMGGTADLSTRRYIITLAYHHINTSTHQQAWNKRAVKKSAVS